MPNYEYLSYLVLKHMIPPDDVYTFLGQVLRYFSLKETIKNVEDPSLIQILETAIKKEEAEYYELADLYNKSFAQLRQSADEC